MLLRVCSSGPNDASFSVRAWPSTNARAVIISLT
jgi:hypothetical protein